VLGQLDHCRHSPFNRQCTAIEIRSKWCTVASPVLDVKTVERPRNAAAWNCLHALDASSCAKFVPAIGIRLSSRSRMRARQFAGRRIDRNEGVPRRPSLQRAQKLRRHQHQHDRQQLLPTHHAASHLSKSRSRPRHPINHQRSNPRQHRAYKERKACKGFERVVRRAHHYGCDLLHRSYPEPTNWQ
jgi:hypothetical protein